MTMALLEMQDIIKSYDGKSRAVDRLSLNLDAGSVCALLGKNGAGKTTTIRIIMGMLPFDSGIVKIKGQQIRESYPAGIKACIGYVPDCNALYGYLTTHTKNIGQSVRAFIDFFFGKALRINLQEI